jgi:pilus assembly protein CpaB
MSIATAEIARPRRGRLYIVVGAILAVLAFAIAAGLASLSLAPGTAAGTKVVVAKTNISARTKIQASDLQLSAFSPAPPQAFTDMALVAGKGARVDIPAGSPITANLIAAGNDLLSTSEVAYLPIPQGFVAITVPTSEQVGVAGYVQVGDRITMLATLNTAIFGATPGAPVVRTVFRDLNIIRVGPVSSNQSTTSIQVPSSLTLVVTQCDAEYLTWLLNNASMKYTLESFTDYSASPPAPDPSCPAISPSGLGPKQVDKRWHFTGP